MKMATKSFLSIGKKDWENGRSEMDNQTAEERLRGVRMVDRGVESDRK